VSTDTERPFDRNRRGFDPGSAYRLSQQVALREEPFGALAYHYGNRRLTFLRSPSLVDLVRGLDGEETVEDAISASPMGERKKSAVCALSSLENSEILEKVSPLESPGAIRAAATKERAEDRRSTQPPAPTRRLTEEMKQGLDAPICLTWELTYGCNLACVHCLSSSGRRDPRELSTKQAMHFIDELSSMKVFYVNVGGGEPTIRSDFFDIVSYCVGRGVGVKFSTNGGTMTAERAHRLASMDYVDVQISIDGATPATNDPVRGEGSFAAARRAMCLLSDAGFDSLKISAVVTRLNVPEIDDLLALAGQFGAELRLTRLRPAGRGVQTWHELHPTPNQQRTLHDWLKDHPEVLTGDSFFHLSAFGEALPGLNLCGAGRIVCLIDPIGDVYACPFVMHPEFKAGSVLGEGGFSEIWRNSDLFDGLRHPSTGGACNACGAFDSCQGGCMAAKFFTGLPLDGPDPECALGHGESALAVLGPGRRPEPGPGHSKKVAATVPVVLGRAR